MDINKNSYILIYATIMVAIVALTLAMVSGSLSERQKANIKLDKKKQILKSLLIETKDENVDEMYQKLITNEILINESGNTIDEGKEVAFNIDFEKEIATPNEGRKLPIYVANIDGKTKYVLSLQGTGLWGPIWGYVALDDDKNTIYGSYFSHKSETPGLGAEIAEKPFQQKFLGKKILNLNNEFVSIAVVKPGQKARGVDYVDGISGSTITCKGVENMLMHSLGQYKHFLENKIN